VLFRSAHLAAKESELVKSRNEFKAEREAIEREKEALRPIHEKLKKFEELKKSDPVAAIKFLEFSDTDFVNYLAAQQDNSTPEEKARKIVQSELDAFRTEQQKKEDDYKTAQNDKIIAEYKADIGKTIDADKDAYELSNLVGEEAKELAYKFVLQNIEEGKEVPTAEEAAKKVEEYYEVYFKDIMKAKKLTPQEAVEQAKEAIAEARKITSVLIPDEKSFRKATPKTSAEQDKLGWMMTC
jgi:hypothetical protein